MELTSDQQFFEQIKKSSRILIALPENLTADVLASGLAMGLFLNKLQKTVILTSSGQIPENLKFLPNISAVQKQIKNGSSLVVTLNISEKKLEEVSYQTTPEKVHIYLKAQTQDFTPQDLTFSTEKFPINLILVLGARSLEDLGQLSEHSADVFFETPKINIDNKAANEYFGAVNLVDITATSVSEILAELLQKYEEQLVDEDIATCLLAGIIAKTNSFQHVQTTPKTFLRASQLVALGGRQQEVVKNIFKTKSLPLLKLWGRALARMKTLEAQSSVYSILSTNDFEKAEAGEAESLEALRELVENISGYKLISILTEPAKGAVKLLAAVHEQVDAENFLHSLGGNGKILNFNLGNFRIVEVSQPESSLEVLESRFLDAIKSL